MSEIKSKESPTSQQYIQVLRPIPTKPLSSQSLFQSYDFSNTHKPFFRSTFLDSNNSKKTRADSICTNLFPFESTPQLIPSQTFSFTNSFFTYTQSDDDNFTKIKSYLLPSKRKAKTFTINSIGIIPKEPQNGKEKYSSTKITNIINNYYISLKSDHSNEIPVKPLATKRKRKSTKRASKSTRLTKLKRKDKSKITVGLDLINIGNCYLKAFPLDDFIPKEELSVEILMRMLNEENYFHINQNLKQKVIYPTNELKLISLPTTILDNLYLIEENQNETNASVIIRNLYKQIKSTILQIQKNFIGKKKHMLNDELCIILKKLITSCNDISSYINKLPNKNNGQKIKEEITPNSDTEMNFIANYFNEKDTNNNNKVIKFNKNYVCDICHKIYSNGQGLGGHMSRIHPNMSDKYKHKINIRISREDKRAELYEIKRKYFAKYALDYDKLMKSNCKKKIQKFLAENSEEYHKFKKEEQKKLKLETIK
jgi:hypothetical protein